MPGYNLASETGTHGYTVGIFEHATPDWNKWHDILKGFGPDLLSVYPPEAKVIREFFVKTTAVEGGDGVLAGLVFADAGLPAVQKLCGEKGLFATQGREEGWVTGKWRGNYYKGDLFRGAAKGAAGAQEGAGRRLRHARPRHQVRGVARPLRLGRHRRVPRVVRHHRVVGGPAHRQGERPT